MSSQHRKISSSRRSRKDQKLKTWFIGFLTLILAGMIIAGPNGLQKLFAAPARQPAAVTTTQPAPATAPTEAPATATPATEAPAATTPAPATGTTTGPDGATTAPGTTATPSPAPAPGGEAAVTAPSPSQPASAAAVKTEAKGEAVTLPFGKAAYIPLMIVLVSALIALAFGFYWWRKTVAHDPGSERMQGVAAAVQEGALAYLSRQVKTMIPLVVVIGIGLFFLYNNQYRDNPQHYILGIGVAIAFILGVTASYLAGYVGMGVAVRGNVRVAHAALSSFKKALEIAFQAGAVSGMFTVGLGLLGATITFLIFKSNAMFVLVGFGFGGSLAALFMRVGGGIFTKAADVGADLVGKVEAGIPEDDPRNAATIADNVGDNVGDCAGMAADVFESYEVTLVAAIILAAAVGMVLQSAGFGSMMQEGTFTYKFTLDLVIYALLVRAVGVFASIIGVMAVRGKDDPNMNPMKPINVGFITSAILASIGFLVVSWFIFGPQMHFKKPFSNVKYNFAKVTYVPTVEMEKVFAAIEKNGKAQGATDAQIAENRVRIIDGITRSVEAIKKYSSTTPITLEGIGDLVATFTPEEEQRLTAEYKLKGPSILEKVRPRMTAISAGKNFLALIQETTTSPYTPPTPALLSPKELNSLLAGLDNHATLSEQIKGNFWWMAFLATFIGIVLTQIIGKITEYFTADDKKPVTEIASSAKTGAATLILAGLSEGLESSVWGIVSIAATITGAFLLFPNPAMAAYAIALTGLGLLATTGYVLAMDTYGPISDNANGIFEMSGALKDADGNENKAAHNIVARLDMVGNTTKALTKGFAIATAVIAAVALYRSFLDTAAVNDPSILVNNIRVNLPDVFVGLLIGGAVPFLFSSFAIRAVSRAAVQLVEEVRRQFRTIPGIWEYTGVGEKGKPDYARCVAISTAAAQKELLGPGLLAVFAPIFVGFALGAYALGGFLAGAILVGQLMAVFMSNTGGAWDNAKKKIEDGFLGGKGSEAHKAGVIGDTVGDPLKDTAGPALNPMIKVMNLVAILVAPSAVLYHGKGVGWIVVVLSLLILTGAVLFSKRGGVKSPDEEESSAVVRQG